MKDEEKNESKASKEKKYIGIEKWLGRLLACPNRRGSCFGRELRLRCLGSDLCVLRSQIFLVVLLHASALRISQFHFHCSSGSTHPMIRVGETCDSTNEEYFTPQMRRNLHFTLHVTSKTR